MNLEISTINVLLGLVVALQVWIVKELYGLKTKVAVIAALCPRCQAAARQKEQPEEQPA